MFAKGYVQKHYSSKLYSQVASDQPIAVYQLWVTQTSHTDKADPSLITITTMPIFLPGSVSQLKCVWGRLQSDHGTDSGRKAAVPELDVRQPGG